MAARTMTVATLLAALIALAGCGGGDGGRAGGSRSDEGGGERDTGRAATPRLLFIGLDSADWRLLDPLMAEGRLPHLKAFRARAASGRMQSFYPLEKSPLLWASICTGVEPGVHGVTDFVRGSAQKPVTGSAWHAPALWDILGAAGRSTFVSGMWTTFPARPIDGIMVSDYLPYGREREKPLAGLVTPDSLAAAVVACRVDPAGLTAEQLARFLPAGADVADAERRWPQQVQKLRDIWAADLGYLEVARRLRQARDFDFYLFYLRGPDMISHGFYHYLAIADADWHGDADEHAMFREVVQRYYDWTDEAVGEVLSWFPPDHPTVIASDHGFYGPRTEGKGTVEHSEWGIFMVRSPLYEAGASFGHLKLLDICPTVLALLDLPPARDMTGVVLATGTTARGRDRLAHIEEHRVESYLALRPAAGDAAPEVDDKVEEEIRRQLRSLGYIK